MYGQLAWEDDGVSDRFEQRADGAMSAYLSNAEGVIVVEMNPDGRYRVRRVDRSMVNEDGVVIAFGKLAEAVAG